MTGVLQVFSRTGSTRTPIVSFGSDGGSFQTGHGYGSASGVRGGLDYNLFADQFNTSGQGVNDEFSNSSQGANVGYAFTPKIQLRLRTRHNNSRAGVPGEWDFNGARLLPPDTDAFARQNNFLGSAELNVAVGNRWLHRFTGYEYNRRALNQDLFPDPGRTTPLYGNIDSSYQTVAHENRAGFHYQGEFLARQWARSIFGYEFEDENGFYGDLQSPPTNHGLRRNHGAYLEELITWKRISIQAGGRYVHNEYFGDRGLPRAALSYLLRQGGNVFSDTRIHGSYSLGIKEPTFLQNFGQSGSFPIAPNPNLKPEQNRAFDAGLHQSMLRGRYSLDAVYFNNIFRDRINYNFDFNSGTAQYINTNKSMAHGAELTVQARPTRQLQLQAGYVYTSSQVLFAPLTFDPNQAEGAPFLRIPKHAGNLLASYTRRKYGVTLAGTLIGRRPDADFIGLVPSITHAAGYARFDAGGWYTVNRHVTAYTNIENLLDKKYNDIVGYPGLGVNVRAGMRFTIGGDAVAVN
jgi:vitamin B12 transporter